jgi:hypothetical protein
MEDVPSIRAKSCPPGVTLVTCHSVGSQWTEADSLRAHITQGAEARGMVFRLSFPRLPCLACFQASPKLPLRQGREKNLWNQGDVQVTELKDSDFADGIVGMAQYGYGRTLFRNLRVEALP